MSYNLALILLPRTDPAALGASPSRVTTFDEASSSEVLGPSAAAVGDHTVVCDPTMTMFELPAHPVAGTAIVELAGVADTYTLRVFGESPRFRVVAEGEVVEDQGVAVPAEQGLEEIDDPEDAHLELFCRLAGLARAELWELVWAPLV